MTQELKPHHLQGINIVDIETPSGPPSLKINTALFESYSLHGQVLAMLDTKCWTLLG